VRLIADPGLRRTLASAGREKVDREYRWSRVIARYEDLWDELFRTASTCTRPDAVPNPFALAPSTVFRHYASHTLDGDTMVIAGGRRVEEPYRDVAGWLDVRLLEELLGLAKRPIRAGDLITRSGVPVPYAWFALAWLMTYGLLGHSEPSFSHPLPRTADFHA
jgi:hypothetical protein